MRILRTPMLFSTSSAATKSAAQMYRRRAAEGALMIHLYSFFIYISWGSNARCARRVPISSHVTVTGRWMERARRPSASVNPEVVWGMQVHDSPMCDRSHWRWGTAEWVSSVNCFSKMASEAVQCWELACSCISGYPPEERLKRIYWSLGAANT